MDFLLPDMAHSANFSYTRMPSPWTLIDYVEHCFENQIHNSSVSPSTHAPSHLLVGVVCLTISILLTSLTYAVSTVKFRASLRQRNSGSPPRTPVLPYFVPGLFHTLSFLNLHVFLSRLHRLGSEKPLLAKAGFLRFFVITNPNLIKAVFRSSKRTTNKSVTLFALRNLLGLPRSAVKFYWADDSGLSPVPRKGSSTTSDNRINFLIAHNVHKFLSSTHLVALNEKYLALLTRDLASLGSESEWTVYPDLHQFIQQITMRSSLEALAGSKLFEIYPTFTIDLSIFLSYVPDILRFMPSWLIPTAYQARQRLLEGIKRWHEIALQNSDYNKVAPEDPEWEPYFGTKLLKIRQQYTLKLEEMTPDARATEDLGLMFAATGNVVTSTFWFIFEALKDMKLLSQLRDQVNECVSDHGKEIDIHKLTSQPLLQSAYAEVLRLYVAGAVSRVAEYNDINIAGYSIPKDSYLLMYSRTMALDEALWSQAGRHSRKPLHEFDPERFLVDKDWTRPLPASVGREICRNAKQSTEKRLTSEPRFSTDGLLGLWMPYGGGDHICPGRHFAKHEILLTFAVLLSEFDLELTIPHPQKVLPNMKFAPFGALPPDCKVPFRMRRKAKC